MTRTTRQSAFSLIELMIAIVILGLGLVMVATMFPVAWDRARRLSETNQAETIAGAAFEVLESALQCGDITFDSANLAGDLIIDNQFANGAGAIVAAPDGRVHALNMQNVLVAGNNLFTGEHPWALEFQPNPVDFLWDPDFTQPGPDFAQRTFHTSRVAFHQRIHPPLRARSGTNFQTSPDAQWDASVDARSFAWSALYRIEKFGNMPVVPNQQVPPYSTGNWSYNAANVQAAREAAIRNRYVEFYVVTLRRPSAVNRYARQAASVGSAQGVPTAVNSTPNPYELEDPPRIASPQALPGQYDVKFPVPWRIQMQFPQGLALAANATGIPTEVQIPADGTVGDQDIADVAVKQMIVAMFPTGSQFIDEVTGQVYRVIKRRITGPQDDVAILTLDREVVAEELDLPAGDPTCANCLTLAGPGFQLDDEERVRTVWVFPPPVDTRAVPNGVGAVTFSGPQPVVSIDTGRVTLVPSVLSQ